MKFGLNNYKSYLFLKLVKKTMVANRMLCAGDRLLVAVSGGPDSIALLYALFFLSHECEISLTVAHFNHMLRGNNSKRDELFVRSVANRLSVPFYSASADIKKVKEDSGLSIEETAREVRYAFFKQLLSDLSYSKVALAHHMEDNAELILMFMLRGSGLDGLSGIPAVRENCFIRPFIRLKKSQIMQFLFDERIKYVEDESNKDLRFTRNNVRHYLIPLLTKSFNPRLVENLNRTSVLITEENEWMDQVTIKEYEKAVINYQDDIVFLSVPILRSTHNAIKRRILRKALLLLLGSLKRINFTHIEATLELLEESAGSKYICLPSSVRISRVYEVLEIRRETKKEQDSIIGDSRSSVLGTKIPNLSVLPITLQDENYSFNFSVLKSLSLPSWDDIGKNVAFLDLNSLNFPITIRYAVYGDRFNALGMDNNQNIRRYFINKKIPLLKRSKVLVVDANGSIIWLVSCSICNYARVTSETKNVLMIKFCLRRAQ